MYKLAIGILLFASPALAQNNDATRNCLPMEKTVEGELLYQRDCKANKPENADADYEPKMPSTNMRETVVPKSGGTQNPAETPTIGVNR
jgi:hypothetical protein